MKITSVSVVDGRAFILFDNDFTAPISIGDGQSLTIYEDPEKQVVSIDDHGIKHNVSVQLK